MIPGYRRAGFHLACCRPATGTVLCDIVPHVNGEGNAALEGVNSRESPILEQKLCHDLAEFPGGRVQPGRHKGVPAVEIRTPPVTSRVETDCPDPIANVLRDHVDRLGQRIRCRERQALREAFHHLRLECVIPAPEIGLQPVTFGARMPGAFMTRLLTFCSEGGAPVIGSFTYRAGLKFLHPSSFVPIFPDVRASAP